MSSKLGRAVAAAGLATLLAPSAASAAWWDGGYQPARREQPPPQQPSRQQPPPEQPPCGSCGPGTEQPAQPAPPPPGTPSAAPPPGSLPSIYGCENTDLPGTAPVLQKSTTPPPGTPVAPGQEIRVEITWRISDWIAPELHKALDCVYLDNRYVPELSGGERPTPNDGHFEYSYVVPPNVPSGSTICDQGFVSGPNGEEDYGREVSNTVCFPVGSPPPPPGPPAPPPPPAETATTVTTVPATTTTTEQPETEAERLSQQTTPGTATPPARPAPPLPEVLPRTGGDPTPGRLAAGALGVAVLLGRGRRRSGPRRPRRS